MTTILWYDLETWNNNPRSARIAQFAAVRTDLAFNPITEPMLYHCAPAKDCVPSPYAVLVHQLLPSKLPPHNTLSELDLLTFIQEQMQQPDTIVCGYNNLRFDNEVLRFSWFRNALDAYAIDYKDDNRWDIIDTVRACHALRPEGIQWQKNELNATSFKLEVLAAANQLNQEKAHDALSDVHATIDMAKLISNKHTKLYDFFFSHRDKAKLLKLMKLEHTSSYHLPKHPPPMLLHISGMITDEQRRTEVILPIAIHPKHKNEVLAIGLKQNPEEWVHLSVEEIRQRVFNKQDVLEELNLQRLRIFSLRLKKAPALAPLSVLKDAHQWEAIKHNQQQCDEHYQTALIHFTTLQEKITQLYNTDYAAQDDELTDADLSLYEHFLSRKDKRLLSQFHHQLNSLEHSENTCSELAFDNPHLHQIIFRTRARNFSHTLTQEEETRWMHYCKEEHTTGKATKYSLAECKKDIELLKQTELNVTQSKLLSEFESWIEEHFPTL